MPIETAYSCLNAVEGARPACRRCASANASSIERMMASTWAGVSSSNTGWFMGNMATGDFDVAGSSNRIMRS
jgi:hypothetical protein